MQKPCEQGIGSGVTCVYISCGVVWIRCMCNFALGGDGVGAKLVCCSVLQCVAVCCSVLQ